MQARQVTPGTIGSLSPGVQAAGVLVVVITALTQAFADLYYRNLGLDASLAGTDSALLTARVGYATAAVAGLFAVSSLAGSGARLIFDRMDRSHRSAGLFVGSIVVCGGVLAAGGHGWSLMALMIACALPGIFIAAAGASTADSGVAWAIRPRTVAAGVCVAVALGVVPVVSTSANVAATQVREEHEIATRGLPGIFAIFAGLELRELYDRGQCEVVVATVDGWAWVLADAPGSDRAAVRRRTLDDQVELSRAGRPACG